MKLTHTLEAAPWTSRKDEKAYPGKLRYVHQWYSAEPGPHHGERLGYQVLLFNSAEHADKWIARENAAETANSDMIGQADDYMVQS